VPSRPTFGYHLVDDFEDRYFNVVTPRGLCQPAADGDDPILAPSRRLTAFSMKSAGGILAHQTNVRIVNELGAITLNTGKPDLLRVPSTVPGATPDPNASLDHYKCYKSFVTPGTPRLQHGLRVTMSDGFTNPPKTFALNKASHLCMPARTDSFGFEDRQIVFLCYAAKGVPGSPHHIPQLGVQLDEEFGTAVLNTVKETEICIPSVRVGP
jgi:hypothetical protein